MSDVKEYAENFKNRRVKIINAHEGAEAGDIGVICGFCRCGCGIGIELDNKNGVGRGLSITDMIIFVGNPLKHGKENCTIQALNNTTLIELPPDLDANIKRLAEFMNTELKNESNKMKAFRVYNSLLTKVEEFLPDAQIRAYNEQFREACR